jgi:hypothetical protein
MSLERVWASILADYNVWPKLLPLISRKSDLLSTLTGIRACLSTHVVDGPPYPA